MQRRGITSVMGWPRHPVTQLGSGSKHGGAGQPLAQSPWTTAAAAPAHRPMLPEARYPEQIRMVLANTFTTGRMLTHEYRACNFRKLLSRARALLDEEHLRRQDFEVQLPLLLQSLSFHLPFGSSPLRPLSLTLSPHIDATHRAGGGTQRNDGNASL